MMSDDGFSDSDDEETVQNIFSQNFTKKYDFETSYRKFTYSCM